MLSALLGLLRYKKFNRGKCIAFAEEYGIKLSNWDKFKIYMNVKRNIDIPFIDLDVTTICNLRCEKCAKIIPYYAKENRKIYSASMVISNLEKLVKYLDHIWVVSIIGGEPFLNKDLPIIIEYCSNNKKFITVNVTTSGSYIPKEYVFEALQKSRVEVKISNYAKLNDEQMKKRDEFIRLLKHYNIKYVFSPHNEWLDFGPVEKRDYIEKIRKKILSECYINGCSVFNQGVLYRCGRASYLANHGTKMSEGQVIVADEIKSRSDLRKRIYTYYSSIYMDACDYCTIYPKAIEPGIQISYDKKINV